MGAEILARTESSVNFKYRYLSATFKAITTRKLNKFR